MGTFSIWHWLILGAVILLLFGRGRLSELMGDAAKGIKAFKRGLADDQDERPVIGTTTSKPEGADDHPVRPS